MINIIIRKENSNRLFPFKLKFASESVIVLQKLIYMKQNKQIISYCPDKVKVCP